MLDGLGTPAFTADVAVDGGHVVGIGAHLGPAGRTLAADGLAVAPGFIDLHTHADFTLSRFPRADAMVRQGVTTLVVGNCGFSPFPVTRERSAVVREWSSFLDGGLDGWTDLQEYAAHLASLPLACNVALLVGHGAVRIATMGLDDRVPTAAELDRMEALVAEAMEGGAFGLSYGLIYPPSSYAETAELVQLARVVARYGGFVALHIRSEAERLVEGVGEALSIGRTAGVGVQISHHKAQGRRNWGRVTATLRMIDGARRAGQDVLADAYPYVASSTTINTLLPAWALEGGPDRLRARLGDEAVRTSIRTELLLAPSGDRTREIRPDAILISRVPDGPAKQYEGSRLSEVGELLRREPVDALLDLLMLAPGGMQMVHFAMSEDDVRRILAHPAVAIASDGWTSHPDAGGLPHPRSYGTFARVLGKYVREDGSLTLEEAVRKMTSLPAQRLGLADRGVLRAGAAADIVVFDPVAVRDLATFEDPHQMCEGVRHVMVGGALVIEDGEDTGAVAGRVLCRSTPPS